MTEESFQQCRKSMRSINYLRGQITSAKQAVGKWTRLDDIHKSEKTKACLDRAIDKLKRLKQRFADMKFPDSNIPDPVKEKPVEDEFYDYISNQDDKWHPQNYSKNKQR